MAKKRKRTRAAAAEPLSLSADLTALEIPSRADTAPGPDPATPRTAVTLPAVWACVDLITSTALMVPLSARVGRETAPLPEWLRKPERWNDGAATMADLVEHAVTGQTLHGAGYLWAETLGPEVWQLWPVDPARVTVELRQDSNGRDTRIWSVDHSPAPLAARVAGRKTANGTPARNRSGLVVIPHRMLPGVPEPVGPIQAARAAVGGYMVTESYGSDILASQVPMGVLTTDQDLTPEAMARYRDGWAAGSRQPVRVLANGLAFAPFRLSPKDAAWLEARAFDSTEVARLFQVPAHKLNLAISGGLTYSNSESLDRDFLRSLAGGYLRPVETALNRLTGPGRTADEELLIGFDYAGLMRATTAERYSAYSAAVSGGWMTLDEVRAQEGLPPLDVDPAP